jgi:hypothetical protein
MCCGPRSKKGTHSTEAMRGPGRVRGDKRATVRISRQRIEVQVEHTRFERQDRDGTMRQSDICIRHSCGLFVPRCGNTFKRDFQLDEWRSTLRSHVERNEAASQASAQPWNLGEHVAA